MDSRLVRDFMCVDVRVSVGFWRVISVLLRLGRLRSGNNLQIRMRNVQHLSYDKRNKQLKMEKGVKDDKSPLDTPLPAF